MRKKMDFISKIKNKHPNLVITGEYINSNTLLKVMDSLGIEYLCKPSNLVRQNKLSIASAINKTEAFIIHANIIHNNKFSYSKTKYLKAHIKIIITCPIHGDFLQTPQTHLGGIGCPHCAIEKSTLTTQNFIERSSIIHNNKYDYSLVNYQKSKIKVNIICPNHGSFWQKPESHLFGVGCAKCHTKGYRRSSWNLYCNEHSKSDPKVYIIRCYNNIETFIKIGITSKDIYTRFKYKFPYSYEVLKEIKGSPDFVWDKEKELHKLCKSFKYTPLIPFQGQTECFTLECLSLLNL